MLRGAALLLLVTLGGAQASPTSHPWNPRPLARPAGADSRRSGWLYVPPTYVPGKPSPLLVMLHGAGKGAREALDLLWQVQPTLDAARCLVLVPESRGATWDRSGSMASPDVRYVQQAVKLVLSQYSVDRRRIAVAGHSDGATMALALLPMGSFVTHFIALSPGGAPADAVGGAPDVFVAHGTRDELFPIDKTSRVIVPWLAKSLLPRQSGLAYLEYSGGHEPTTPVLAAALAWFLLDKPVPGAELQRPAAAG